MNLSLFFFKKVVRLRGTATWIGFVLLLLIFNRYLFKKKKLELLSRTSSSLNLLLFIIFVATNSVSLLYISLLPGGFLSRSHRMAKPLKRVYFFALTSWFVTAWKLSHFSSNKLSLTPTSITQKRLNEHFTKTFVCVPSKCAYPTYLIQLWYSCVYSCNF